MRKTVLAALLAVLISGPARAGLLDLGFHAGYTSVSMADLNHANAATYGWYPSDHTDSLSSGYVLGLDLTSRHLTRLDWLKLGLRGEYLRTNPAEMDSIHRIGINSSRLDYVDQGNMAGALVGASVSAPFIAERLDLAFGAWFGGAYGTMAQGVSFNGGKGSTASSAPSNGVYTSMYAVGELESTLSWRLNGRLSLDFSGGWRWADAGNMKDDKGTALYDTLQYWQFNRKTPVNVDFSGLSAQGGLKAAF
jgi:hypothetical protein